MSKKTVENLKAAFAGESKARNMYTFFAETARKEGREEIAELFEEAAENEKKHAEIILQLLKGIGSTEDNLRTSIEGETHEFTSMYPEFLRAAEEEGQNEAASYFRNVIASEKDHAEKFQKKLDKLENKDYHEAESSSVARWRCKVCGFIYEGDEPPQNCPLCKQPREKFNPA